MYCEPYPDTALYIFSSFTPSLLYYSHFTAIVVSLLVAFFVARNSKTISSYALILMSVVFSVWAFLDILLWTQTDTRLLMLLWSNWFLMFSIISLFSPLFLYLFVNNRMPRRSYLVLGLFILIPVLFGAHVKNVGIEYFDVYACNAIEGWYMIKYVYLVSLFSLVAIIVVGIRSIYLSSGNDKKKNFFAFLGLLLFWLFFSIPTYIASVNNLIESSADTFNLEQYGYFGATIFMFILSYTIVRYKAFDIKLLATQALIWALIILVGSQFFFIRNPINYVLNGITFVGAIVSGILIVRSVKLVDAQREELTLANQEQETLVHFITHQIKGYFTKSRNIFDTLTDMENVPDGAQRLIGEGLRSDKEGVELVENILNAANLKTGKMQFKDEKGSLDQMIKKLVDDLAPLATAKNLKINFYCSAPIQFNADAFRLKDLFKNLISNAINYTFEGGITIYLNKKSDYAEFIIKDTGVGLTEDDKRRLFTSGGRGSESVKYNVSSTGYGLYIAKKVVDYYHGRIWAESEGRNKGTTFVVTLPLEK